MRYAIAIALIATLCHTQTVTNYVLQVNDDGSQTIPPNTIATPKQIEDIGERASSVAMQTTLLLQLATSCDERINAFGTNYIVTSTCYVRSVGGISYNPDLQAIRLTDITKVGDNLEIVGLVCQIPLTPPVLDWRTQLNGGEWETASSTVIETDLPATLPPAPGDLSWVRAYKFTVPIPQDAQAAFFRAVDNSSGASGSGLYWVVFGGIAIDGHLGATADITDNDNRTLKFRGGVLVEDEPL